MNWILASVLCFILWSAYAVPGNFAEKIHGVSVNMLFETAAFIGVTLLMAPKIVEGLPKVTASSAGLGMLMGIGSAFGFYYFLTAMSLAPNSKSVALIILVAGVSFPAQSVLFSFFGDALSLRQWLAIGGMALSLVVFNWE